MVDPAVLGATRRSLHAVAEWVLAPARHAAEGRIGLRATRCGFGTPPFAGGRCLRVDGTDLVVEHLGATDADGASAAAPLTTLAAAAAFAGVEPGRHSGVYRPVTAWDPDRPLDLNPGAAALLADWFAFGTSLLEDLRAVSAAPTIVQLWPEHFDVAVDVGDEAAGHRVNLGASPGDDDHPLPYLYVGPWSGVDRVETIWNEPFWNEPFWNEPFWNEPFGASLGYEELAAGDDRRVAALEFLRRGRDLS